MREPLLLATALATFAACATAPGTQGLARLTSSFVVDRPLVEVWPLAKEVLAERHIVAFPSGEGYRLATAIVGPSGELPSAGPAGSGGPAAAGPPPAAAGRGRGGGRTGGGHSGPRESPRSKLARFVVEGLALDPSHCQVRFLRYDRDSIDGPESLAERDTELEWAFISRAVPDRAEALEHSLTGAGAR